MIPRRDLPGLPLEVHLAELRKRLLFCLIVFFLFWCLLFYFFPKLSVFFIWPYQKAMGSRDMHLVFTTLPEAIMAAVKATFFLALTLTLPFLLYQGWTYIASGLFPDERRFAKKILIVSFILMVFGVALGYFVFLPPLLKFFLSFGYANFEANLRVQNYLSFIGKTLLISALVTEIPLAVAVLSKYKIISRDFFRKKKWYFWVGIYLLALFLVPGDFISQILIFMAFYLLFELGFILAKVL